MTFKGYKVRNISLFLCYPNGVKLHVYQDIIMATEQMLYLTNGHNFFKGKSYRTFILAKRAFIHSFMEMVLCHPGSFNIFS